LLARPAGVYPATAGLRQFCFSGGAEGGWGEFRPALFFPLSLFSLALEAVFRKAKCAAEMDVALALHPPKFCSAKLWRASPTRARAFEIKLPKNFFTLSK